MTDPIDFPNGVYGAMPAETYHAIQRVSASFMKKYHESPMLGWRNHWTCPIQLPEPKSKAKDFGTATHTLLLDGPDEFARRYKAPFERPEDAPDTIDELRAWLDDAGIDYKRSLRKGELVDLVEDNGGQTVASLRQAYDDDGRIELSNEDWQVLQLMATIRNNAPELKRDFSGGQSEVTVLWDYALTLPSGEQVTIPVKSRFDYIKPGEILDLKTTRAFAHADRLSIETIKWTYHLSTAFYLQAAKAGAALIEAGQAHDLDPGLAFGWPAAVPDRFTWIYMHSLTLQPARMRSTKMAQEIGEAQIEQVLTNYHHRLTNDEVWLEPIQTYDLDLSLVPEFIFGVSRHDWTDPATYGLAASPDLASPTGYPSGQSGPQSGPQPAAITARADGSDFVADFI